jgi:hypothetical protein
LDPSNVILDQEARGQAELLKSDVIPVDYNFCSEQDLLDLGFQLGEQVDDLFRKAIFPKGWLREGSDHAMWSYINDELGRKRVAIFYKAAFYDRNAHLSIENVRSYVLGCICEEQPVQYDDKWATPQAVLNTATEAIEKCKQDIKDMESYYPQGISTRQAELAGWEIVAEDARERL